MHGRGSPGNIGMSVDVLTMGFWPTYPTVSAVLPPEVNRFVLESRFTSKTFFYCSSVGCKKSLLVSIWASTRDVNCNGNIHWIIAYWRDVLKKRFVLIIAVIRSETWRFQAIKEFHVSLYQALVLLLFNQHQELTYSDIQEQTKIRE